jgi:hypothetical protein
MFVENSEDFGRENVVAHPWSFHASRHQDCDRSDKVQMRIPSAIFLQVRARKTPLEAQGRRLSGLALWVSRLS